MISYVVSKEQLSEELNSRYVMVSTVLGAPVAYVCENGVYLTLEDFSDKETLKKKYDIRSSRKVFYDYDYLKRTGKLRTKQAVTESKGIEQNTNSVRQVKIKQLQVDSVMMLYVLLGITSIVSMYISTLHTATYLANYADIFSAWLMSLSVTLYNGAAFEVSVLFHYKKHNFLAVIFMFLWVIVTLFSMITTVSVFYDKFTFNEAQLSKNNKSAQALEVLQKKEQQLREDIVFKKKDIEYRQEKDYATSAVRVELTELQNELQKNLTEQQTLIENEETNTIVKESLFSFISRILHINGGILEFIMSTLSAIFVNLIAPLSLTAVTELTKQEKTKNETDSNEN